jgi:hypothetical protein
VIRLMLTIVAACAFVTACSGASAPPSGAAGDKAAAPGPAAPPAAASASEPGAPSAGAPAAAAPAARTAEAARAAVPTFREVTIPAGTSLTVKLTTPIGSDTSKVEDPVTGTLARSILVSGETAVPAGAQVMGSVLETNRSGRVKGRASIAFRFDRLAVGGERHQIETDGITREATADRKGDVKKGGVGAGAGAIIGGIAGGGKGAAIGSVVGGTGAVMATRGKEVRLAAGDTVTTKLREPLTIQVATDKK